MKLTLQQMNTHRPNGFTLIELVVVIAIIAILAAFALPRFADLADDAHRSSVEGSGGAMAAAVALARSQWLANGSNGEVTDLQGYGDDTIDTSADGWPTGVNGNNNPDSMSDTECRDLWSKLLQTSAPSVSVGTGSDYQATVNGGDCRYTYQRDTSNNYIEYDPNDGNVFTQIN